MAEAVYLLCALTSMACAALLLRSYTQSRMRLILWTSLCFAALALNNVLLFMDFAVLPRVDLSAMRDLTSFAAVAILLYGLISSDLA